MTQAGPAKMRLVMVNRFYWPDRAATAQMLQDLAEDLVADGHDILVVASRSWYAGEKVQLARSEVHNGVKIRRIGGTTFGRRTTIGRLFDYLSFLAAATWWVLTARGRDVVVMTDPPLSFVMALLATKVRGGRVVHWVQDLFPALATKLGALSSRGIVNRCYSALSPYLHRGCRLTIALGPRMADVLTAEGARRDQLAVCHNWADTVAIRPIDPAKNSFLKHHDLIGRFVVLYSGNAGRGHEFSAVRAAMLSLRDDESIRFVFIGGGAQMPSLRRFSTENSLRNVSFFDYVAREELAETLSSASVSLVTEDPRVTGLLLPSKTYGILAAGRPIIFLGSIESDVATIVLDNEAGLVLDPFCGERLAAALRSLRDDNETTARLSANARRAAETKYDRRIATARWIKVTEAALR